jgi:L-alanine-DL-glutamate epimerase-like enolase superfamily enzyme
MSVGSIASVPRGAARDLGTIDAVVATPFRLDYTTPTTLSDGTRTTADQILVRVTTSHGAVGYSECIPRPGIYGETLAGACATIEHVLAPRVIGLPLTDLGRINAALATLKANPAARSSIEVGVLDALAKSLDLPVYRLLGGATDSIPCAAVLPSQAPDVVVAHALALQADLGITMFKLKVGDDATRDAAAIAALRRELGPAATLYADANGRFRAAEAARFLKLTAAEDLWGIEEPIAAGDLVAREQLAARFVTTIIGDESCSDVHAVATELSAKRVTGVSIKLARTGILASIRIREHCASLGAPTVIGTQADSAIGAFASAAFAAASSATANQPAEVLFFRDFAVNPVDVTPDVAGGRMRLPNRPGLGFDVDAEALAQCVLK